MKKVYSILVSLMIASVGFAQVMVPSASGDIEAQVYMTFEAGEIIPDGTVGVASVNGTELINIKNGASGIVQTPNAIVDDGGENVLFVDYDGHLKFDHTLLNKEAFSLAAKYKWTGNSVWWCGILSFVGYDADGPADDGVGAGYVSQHFQMAKGGNINGLGIVQAGAFPKDVYNDFVITYNQGEVNFYVDGNLVGSASNRTVHALENPSLYLGMKTRTDLATGDVTPYLEGVDTKSTQVYMDNVALFNRALTAQEVADIYAGTSSITTDVKALSFDDVAVYPNPIVNELFVSSSDVVKVEVFNIAGRKVLSSAIGSEGIDVSSLTKGVYLVKCLNVTGVEVSVSKIVKK